MAEACLQNLLNAVYHATVLTLIITPAMLMLLANLASWRRSRLVRRAERRTGAGAAMPMPAE